MSRPIIAVVLTIVIACGLVSCGPSRFVRPIGEGESRFQASSGVFRIEEENGSNEAFPIIAMLSGASVGYGFGVTESLTAWTAFYPGFLFGGALYAEIGSVAGILTPSGKGFGLSVSPRTHLGLQFGEGLFGNSSRESQTIIIPQVDLNAYYEFQSTRPYVGVGMYLPLMGSKDKIDVDMEPMLHAGLALKSRSSEVSFEIVTHAQSIDEIGTSRRGRYGFSVSITTR